MKKRLSMKKALAIFTPCITVCVALIIVIAILTSMFWKDISLFISGRKQTVDAKALASGAALCEDIVEEGAVLLKNEKDINGRAALPLNKDEIKKVNVFGWAGFDWMTSAFGSGYSDTTLPKTKLYPALEAAGIEQNKDLAKMYEDFYCEHTTGYNKVDDLEYRGACQSWGELYKAMLLHEPGKAFYTDAIRDSITSHSDVALVVLGRTGTESQDLQLFQQKQPQTNGLKPNGSSASNYITDDNKNYLQISTEEEEMIEVAKETCEKVIVILNTANVMETGFIDDEGIDAALHVGITGLTGVNGLINILRGERPVKALDKDGNVTYDKDNNIVYETNPDGSYVMEPVSPSGRTADTYAYDILGANPATLNQSRKGAARAYSSGKGNAEQDEYVDYSEGIYVGYKWYETADAAHFWDSVDNEYGKGYEGVVQFPFGYGLSYTKFEWKINHAYLNENTDSEKEINLSNVTALGKNDVISVYVEVTNKTGYPGMDVVELYYTAPYTPGGIEKSFVNLGAFAKTGVIGDGGSDIVRLELSVQSMASYDCYDANKNNHTGYELDGKEYELKLMKNSHEYADMADGQDAIIKCSVPDDGYNYDTDEATGNTVENRFTNKDGNGNDKAIDNNDLDGSRESVKVEYLTRADFATSFSKIKTETRSLAAEALSVARAMDPTDEQLAYAGFNYTSARTQQKNDLEGKWAEFVNNEKALDYDHAIWDELIANISNTELALIISNGYFKTSDVPSIGKPEYTDLDGPLGMNTRVTGTAGCSYIAYPSPTVLAQTWNEEMAHQMGLSVGNEAMPEDGVYGWYAPGANIHRSPFSGRNCEYYAEDPILSGAICAKTVQGAKENKVYSYIKHFVANDSELGRNGLFTFLTEQTLRETYLRPFEIAIKEGGGNALMTSMNRLGRVWSGGNYGLMTEIVRGEWGFNGTAVTDWVDPTESAGLNGTSSDYVIYMPPYRGIWAGNDIWLTNGAKDMNGRMHLGEIDKLVNNPNALVMMERVAHDVLWTFVDTVHYNPDSEAFDYSKGAVYDVTFLAIIIPVEVVLFAGAGVMAFFLARAIIREKKGKSTAEVQPETETTETTETTE